MADETTKAGYVPGAADADGSEDPVPTGVLQSTGAASAGPAKSTNVNKNNDKKQKKEQLDSTNSTDEQ